MVNSDPKSNALFKLKLLSDYQKLTSVLDKESDKLHEVKGKQKDAAEIENLKNFLNKK